MFLPVRKMVRNTHPHYLENVSRQRENMTLDLEVALTRLEEASRVKFEVRMEELIFPEKIWLICHTNLLSRFMTWGQEDGLIMINLDEFEKGLLSNQSTSHLFKTGKLVSFIRQFNLYDFKKKHDVFLDLNGDGNYIRFGLYYHEFLRPNYQQLLQNCARKVNKKGNGSGMLSRHGSDMDVDEADERERVPCKRRLASSRPSSSSSSSLQMIVMDLETSPEQMTISQLELANSKPSFKKFSSGHLVGLTPCTSSASSSSSPPQRTFGMTTRSRPAFTNKDSESSRKRTRDLQRVYLVQRWMEMPKEWNDLPEMQRQGTSAAAALINQYNWNLDPMQVGELAALANYGVHDDPFVPEAPEAEVPVWLEDFETIPLNESETGFSYINL